MSTVTTTLVWVSLTGVSVAVTSDPRLPPMCHLTDLFCSTAEGSDRS
jgi:hypothetical protein